MYKILITLVFILFANTALADDQYIAKLTKKAEAGDAEAQYNLGVMHGKGQGTPQNYKEAIKWYQLAADQELAVAQHNLGNMHYKGQGTSQNYKKSLKWHQLAAEQGFAHAQYNLGTKHAKGQGTPQNFIYAHMWLNIAAANDYKNAPEAREIVANNMTTADIATAQDLAQKCIKKAYKNCETL